MDTIHKAGPMYNLVQHCTRCGYTLSDYRNAASPDADWKPRGWTAGAFVTVTTGNPTQTVLGATEGAVHCDAKVS